MPIYMLSRLLNKWTFPVVALLLTMGCAAPVVHIPDTVALKSPKPDKAIVFIHGLNGHPVATWTNEETKAYWPEMLRTDPDLPPGFSVYSLSYNAQMFDGNLTLNEMGQSLKSDLRTQGLTREGQYKEIYFVAHSMGNLALRSMMANEPELFRGVKIPLVISLGSPSEGSELASLGRMLMPGNSALENLASAGNKQLSDLNKRWQETNNDTVFACGYETLPTQGLGLIVGKPSALAVCDGERWPLPADHIHIAKPRDRKDRIYSWTKHELLEAARRIQRLGDIQFVNDYDRPIQKIQSTSEEKIELRASKDGSISLDQIRAMASGVSTLQVANLVVDMVPQMDQQISCSDLLVLLKNAYSLHRGNAIIKLSPYIKRPISPECLRDMRSVVYSVHLEGVLRALFSKTSQTTGSVVTSP